MGKPGYGFKVNKTQFSSAIRQKRMMLKRIAEEDIIEELCKVGEIAVKIARENGAYNDISGNLRSSIGYSILKNGREVKRGLPQQFKGKKGDGSKGVAEGQKLLRELKSRYPRGIVLIVSAGMNYASYVEDLYHRDVLTSAELKAERLAKALLSALAKQK